MSSKEGETSPATEKLAGLTQAFLKAQSHRFYTSISNQQAATTKDRPAYGQIWASRTILPAPKDDTLLTAVMEAVKDLGDGSTDIVPPLLADVKIQWSGFRSGVSKNDEEPNISEREKYDGLMKDTKSKTTILYVHGGFYL